MLNIEQKAESIIITHTVWFDSVRYRLCLFELLGASKIRVLYSP